MRMMGLGQRRAVQSFCQRKRSVVHFGGGGCYRGKPEIHVTVARVALRDKLLSRL